MTEVAPTVNKPAAPPSAKPSWARRLAVYAGLGLAALGLMAVLGVAFYLYTVTRDLPSVEALGVVGRTPFSGNIAGLSPFTSWYGAIGVNVNVPIFNGFLYPARSREAGLPQLPAQRKMSPHLALRRRSTEFPSRRKARIRKPAHFMLTACRTVVYDVPFSWV